MSEEQNIPQKSEEDKISVADDTVNPGEVNENISSPQPDSEKKQPVQSAEEPKSINDKPETETMEVHHHGHVHHQKKWKEYLFQFLMLFLAVFCGFLAEWQLEHTIEHQREKEYIHSLIEDLKLDTATLNHRVVFCQSVRARLDTMLFYLYHSERDKHTADIYYGVRGIMTKGSPFRNHDRTIVQLKNAGGLRLIRNTKVSDSIIIYDSEMVGWVRDQEESILFAREKCRDIIGDVFDTRVLIEATPQNANLPSKPAGNPPLFTNDAVKINQLAMRIDHLRKVYRNTEISGYQQALEHATRLIGFIKKEYHFK
jgi:hypothetical protein